MALINYKIYSASAGSFSASVTSLLSQLNKRERIIGICFFSTLTNNNYSQKLNELKSIVHAHFEEAPLLTLVAQSPLNSAEVSAEITELTDEIPLAARHYRYSKEGAYCSIETERFRAVLTEGILPADMRASVAVQSKQVFEKIAVLLDNVAVPPEYIVRQWNYIGHITDFDHNGQHYQDFNNARADFYANTVWTNGYPAATGISMDVNVVIVQVFACQFYAGQKFFSVDNPMQIAAHLYSPKVLANASEKQTPKFERAKILLDGPNTTCYVSGTAAILGETSSNENDIENQTLQTIRLINNLISGNNMEWNGVPLRIHLQMKHLRVYVKSPDYFEAVQQLVHREWPGVEALYLCASVCRDELLVEIEGIALNEESI